MTCLNRLAAVVGLVCLAAGTASAQPPTPRETAVAATADRAPATPSVRLSREAAETLRLTLAIDMRAQRRAALVHGVGVGTLTVGLLGTLIWGNNCYGTDNEGRACGDRTIRALGLTALAGVALMSTSTIFAIHRLVRRSRQLRRRGFQVPRDRVVFSATVSALTLGFLGNFLTYTTHTRLVRDVEVQLGGTGGMDATDR
ncbi:MAG: hypothetical protein AAGH15_06815 [Myxococcota bacterium]